MAETVLRSRRLGAAAAIGMLLSTLAACGQKGPLYLPDHPPASHRHGAAPKAAAAPAAASAASTPSSNPPTQP